MKRITDIFEAGELFDGRFKLIELLNTSGGSADVWLALDTNTVDESMPEDQATRVVIKVYRPKNLIDIEGEDRFRKEFKKVFNCHHENIVNPTNFSIFEDMPYLVLPYCPAGSSELLVGQLDKNEDIWKYIFEVASGLAYLHEHTPLIIHQDIKPANVLIDDNGNYAITDFGISTDVGGLSDDEFTEASGTFAYMAPERFREDYKPIPQSDIWAFGATLFELVTGNVPFGEDGGSNQSEKTAVPNIDKKIDDSIKKLISACLSYDIQQRPTAQSIVDTVLKKRYSRNKKTILLVLIGILLMGGALTIYFSSRLAVDPEAHLQSLKASADSIVNIQIDKLRVSEGVPDGESTLEFRKALVLYNKILKDSESGSELSNDVAEDTEAINQVISKIEDFQSIDMLVKNAMATEMEDSVAKYLPVLQQQQVNINNLINTLK